MGHPHRHLAAFIDGELPLKHARSIEHHLEQCQRCREAAAFQRGIRSRLRGPVPGPQRDLAQRILARTHGTGVEHTATASGSSVYRARSSGWAREAAAHPGPSRRRRAAAIAGAVSVVAGATLGSAYLIGSEPEPVASPDQQHAISSGWNAVATSTPMSLVEDQVDELRAEGWNCPALESLGYGIESADAITVRGTPTVRLKLSDGTHSLTVYEQRKLSDVKSAQAPPVNAVTGNSVTSDGFERMGGTGRDLWVNPAHSWQVVLDAESVTYTLMSNTPPADMPAAVQQVVYTEQAQLSPVADVPANDPFHRVLRGLARMSQTDGN